MVKIELFHHSSLYRLSGVVSVQMGRFAKLHVPKQIDLWEVFESHYGCAVREPGIECFLKTKAL